MPTENKTTLRRFLRRIRQNLSPEQRRNATRRINRHLYRAIRRGRRIGVYWAVGSELNIQDFIAEAQRRGALIYLPYISKRQQQLWFTPYPGGTHKADRTRPSTPAIPQFTGKKIRAYQLQTLIVPLIGIDTNGFRLGQGGGFYDVTLAHTRHHLQPRSIGVGFACQQLDSLPVESHDQPLKAFVCEYGWQKFNNKIIITEQIIYSENVSKKIRI